MTAKNPASGAPVVSRSARGAVRLIGRARELAVITAQFEEGARLVTLRGVGGVGKSAIAAEVAATWKREGRGAIVAALDGASTLVEIVDRLGELVASPRVDEGVAEPASAATRIGRALDALGDVLLVLDGFDDAVGHGLASVGAWLELAPELSVIVTSREALGLVAESVVDVGAFDVRAGAAGAADAVELLATAARRAASAWTPRPEDLPLLVECATILDGIPLALEIAGARLPIVGARGLRDELLRDPLLARRTHGGPARHASVEAALAGSWRGLSPAHADVLADLTVFRGGFSLAAASGLVALSSRGGGGLTVSPRAAPDRDVPDDVVDVVEALLARSLLVLREGGRFDVLAPLRAFAARALPARVAAAKEHHAAWFVAEAERVASARSVASRRWLVTERENVLAVVHRALEGGVPPASVANLALRALVAVFPVLSSCGAVASLAAAVGPVVERTRDSGADPRHTARALALRGAMRRERGDPPSALKDLLAAQSIARAIRDDVLAASIVLELGKTVLAAGELAAAREHFDRAARAFAMHVDRFGEADATLQLGLATGLAGEHDGAIALLDRAVALAGDDPLLAAAARVALARARLDAGDRDGATRALDGVPGLAPPAPDGDAGVDVARAASASAPVVLADAALLRGLVAHDAGAFADAAAWFARARDASAFAGDVTGAAIARGHLGLVAEREGRAGEAYALVVDARDVAAREGRGSYAAYFALHLALVEAALGRSEAAAAHLAFAAAPPPDRGGHPVALASLVAAVGARLGGTEIAIVGGVLARLLLAGRSARGPGAPLAPAGAIVAPAAPLAPMASPLPVDALVVGDGGAWFRAPGSARVGLERRRSLGLLLERLAVERVERPGHPLSSATLFVAAWPGEKALARAAGHRVRVAIATLRKMGLRDLLVTTGDGYALAPAVPLARA